MIASLQAIVGNGDLSGQSKYVFGLIIIANITFMIYVICHDLAEQLELIHELDNEVNEHGTYELHYQSGKLIGTSIFFANLEHFWGMMETCQESMTHITNRYEKRQNVVEWIKDKLAM